MASISAFLPGSPLSGRPRMGSWCPTGGPGAAALRLQHHSAGTSTWRITASMKQVPPVFNSVLPSPKLSADSSFQLIRIKLFLLEISLGGRFEALFSKIRILGSYKMGQIQNFDSIRSQEEKWSVVTYSRCSHTMIGVNTGKCPAGLHSKLGPPRSTGELTCFSLAGAASIRHDSNMVMPPFTCGSLCKPSSPCSMLLEAVLRS